MTGKPTYEELEHRVQKLEKEAAEYKQVAEKLRKDEKKYQNLVENISEVIFTLDLEGVFTFISSSVESFGGYTVAEVVGKPFIQFVHTDHLPVLAENYEAVIAGNDKSSEYRIFSKSGDTAWVRSSSSPIYEDGKIIGIRGTISDINDQKKAELALLENEEKFRLSFQTSPDSININTLKEGTYLDINDGFTKIMGYTREDVIGKSSLTLNIWKNPEDRDRLVDGLTERGYVENLEAEFVGKNGKVKSGLMSARTVTMGGEKVIISITRDISERKRMEESLRESEDRFRTLFESVPVAIQGYSPDGTIHYWNNASEIIYGYQKNEAIGKNLVDLIIPPVMQDEVRSSIKQAGKTGEIPPAEELSLMRKDGSRLPVFSSHAFIDQSGKKPELYCLDVDMTEIKQLQTQLQQAQRMESIGTLAGGIAHDFNNILFPIIGHTEMLLEDMPPDGAFRNHLDEIHIGALRARDLTKQILTFSRQGDVEKKLMKIQPVVEEALKLIRSAIPASIEIKQDIRKECGLIEADYTQIHQVVMNLATNAYHAMEDMGGELKVGLKEVKLGKQDAINLEVEPGTYACLTVTDMGAGIEKEVRVRIFDPFFTTKEKGKGTGMGLSVVHGIVHNAGGGIKVNSEPGKGSEFHVYLPVVKGYFLQQEAQTNEPIQGGSGQILLVDDEEAIVTMEKLQLERLGYQVVARTSSVEALEAFRARPDEFDVVITDMSMPNMSGDMLASELVKIRPDVPILLCTGFSEKMSEERAMISGIKGFLMKPIARRDLANMICKVLDKGQEK